MLVLVTRTDRLVRCHHFHVRYSRHNLHPQHRCNLSLELQGDVGGRLRDDVRNGDGVGRVREAPRRRQHKVRLQSSDVVARQAPASARQGDTGFPGLNASAMKGPHIAPIHTAPVPRLSSLHTSSLPSSEVLIDRLTCNDEVVTWSQRQHSDNMSARSHLCRSAPCCRAQPAPRKSSLRHCSTPNSAFRPRMALRSLMLAPRPTAAMAATLLDRAIEAEERAVEPTVRVASVSST